MKILGEATKQELHDFLYDSIGPQDKNLYQEVSRSQFGIFQMSGNTASRMIQEANVETFEDLISINALSRPGSSFGFPAFCENNGSKYPEQISKYLQDSRGCILFQEQIMKIFQDIRPDDRSFGNTIRGLLKKLGKANKKQEDIDKWNSYCQEFANFYKGKISQSQIDSTLQDILTLSSYSFNKSHALAYSYIALQTTYLATYFRAPFYAANLTNEAGKKDSLKEAIENIKKSGFQALPPDVNTSNISFTPLENDLVFGLGDIKGVGEEPTKNIIECRPYTSIIDFIIKTLGTKVNKRITMALVGSGAFDNLIGSENRKKYFDITSEFYERKKTKKKPELLQELWQEIEQEHSDDLPTDNSVFIEMENTYLGGNFFHGAFSSERKEKIEKLVSINRCLRTFEEARQTFTSSSVNVCVHCTGYKYWTQKNGQEMLFFECEDMSGEKISMPIFGNLWEHVKKVFYGENIFYFIKCYYNDVNDQIMFGSKKWTKDPGEIRRMLIRWDLKS